MSEEEFKRFEEFQADEKNKVAGMSEEHLQQYYSQSLLDRKNYEESAIEVYGTLQACLNGSLGYYKSTLLGSAIKLNIIEREAVVRNIKLNVVLPNVSVGPLSEVMQLIKLVACRLLSFVRTVLEKLSGLG